MKNPKNKQTIVINGHISLEDLVAVSRYNATVEFSKAFTERVIKCRTFVDEFSKAEQPIYGITTGLGDNVKKFISVEDRKIIQQNHLRSHATSVGEPANDEIVRAIMFVMLCQLGHGYSGIRIETLEQIKKLLNHNIIPYVPMHGSVGYLSLEAHIALVLTGEGKAYVDKKLMSGKDALNIKKLSKIEIESKEGLSLVSGTTSVTGIGALALYDAIQVSKTADISASISLESLKGTLMAFDDRIMRVRPHEDQVNTASNVRRLLSGSEIVQKYDGYRVQDALSLRCIPQLHGASKRQLKDALEVIEIELNASCDNPLIFEEEDAAVALMGCNADGSYVGMSMDALNIAITGLGKMSERRTDRLLNSHVSELPAFLVNNPGLNNGLMISQYTSAGLVAQMRLHAHPATIDNNITCAVQEDYISMGFNASMQAYKNVGFLKYIIATELFTGLQAKDFYEEKSSECLEKLRKEVRVHVPFIKEDCNMSDYIEQLAVMIQEGEILDTVESLVGPLDF